MRGTVSPPPRVSDPNMHHGTCVTHVTWYMPGSLTSDFLWSRWRGKRSRHSRGMRNPQFYVSGKRPTQKCDKHVLAQQNTVCFWFRTWKLICDTWNRTYRSSTKQEQDRISVKLVWNTFIWLKVFSDVLPSTTWAQVFLLSQELSSDVEMYLSASCKGISIVIVDKVYWNHLIFNWQKKERFLNSRIQHWNPEWHCAGIYGSQVCHTKQLLRTSLLILFGNRVCS